MRQKNVIWTVVLVIAVIAVVVIGFSVARQPENSMESVEHTKSSGMHDHNETEVAVNNEEHHTEDSSDQHNRSSQTELSGVVKDDRRVVKVKARRFEFDPNRIVIGKGETVRLEVTSQDVTHGIGIEEYDISRELEPDKTETIIFTADKEGRFRFHCSVYCGKGHSDMHGELAVIERENDKKAQKDEGHRR